MGFIKREGNNKFRLLRNNNYLLQLIEEENKKNIDIKEDSENRNKMNGIKEEIRWVKKLQNILDKKIKGINKDIFLTYDDIITKDNLSNYIAVKSNDGIASDIKILSEDNFVNNILDTNDFQENSIYNFNKSFSNKNNNINNDINNENNPTLYEQINHNKEIMNKNNKNNKSLNLMKSQNPFEFHFIYPDKQDTVFDKNNSIFLKEGKVNDNKKASFNYAAKGGGESYTIIENESNSCFEILIIISILIMIFVFL